MIYRYSEKIEIEIEDRKHIYIYEKDEDTGKIELRTYERRDIYKIVNHAGTGQLYFNGFSVALAFFLAYKLLPYYDYTHPSPDLDEEALQKLPSLKTAFLANKIVK